MQERSIGSGRDVLEIHGAYAIGPTSVMKQPAQDLVGLVHERLQERIRVAPLRDAKAASKQILAERIVEAVRVRAEAQTTA